MFARKKIRLGRLGLALASLLALGVAASGSGSSTNFILSEDSTPGAAGNAASPNFRLVAAVPDSPVGATGVSANFRLEMELVPESYLPDDLTAPVIVGAPAVIYIGSDRALVEWTTDELSDGRVEHGLTTSYGSTTMQTGSYT